MLREACKTESCDSKTPIVQNLNARIILMRSIRGRRSVFGYPAHLRNLASTRSTVGANPWHPASRSFIKGFPVITGEGRGKDNLGFILAESFRFSLDILAGHTDTDITER